MKGAIKSIKRAPHMLTSKVGMATKSTDAETDELVRKFTGLEDYTTKLLKDSQTFRDAVNTMLTSQVGFSTAFATLFQPINDEASLTSKFPQAATTLRNIASYQELMAEVRDAIQPELDLVDARVVAPLKEYSDLLKKIRKTITKREHKLVDYDRFNNSYNKLKDKKEKSLSDEKNLFKLEQDLEMATQEYEFYNNALKTEIPHFLQLTTAFITPIFQTFYFIKVGILYTLLEKINGWGTQTYGELSVDGLEAMHYERLGDAVEQLDSLTITKRMGNTARMVQQHRQASGSETSSLGRRPSAASSFASKPPPTRSYSGSNYGAGAGTSAAASELPPPAYSTGSAGAATGLAGKRPPPPPPSKRPGAAVQYVTALYDYTAQADGDLSFAAGDRIELVKRTESSEDWWTGRLNGVEGVFPGNYVQTS
ncbi:BAR adaptor protein Hob1 [Microbotryomycetes sp. JL221]|nr:BAR adaptor protein Hob1 [Microbotryomycetes sp. JL221]